MTRATSYRPLFDRWDLAVGMDLALHAGYLACWLHVTAAQTVVSARAEKLSLNSVYED